MAEALRPVAAYLPDGGPRHAAGEICGAAHAFVRARYYWPPRPDEEPDLEPLEAEWTALENSLLPPPRGGEKLAPGVAKLSEQVSIRAAAGDEEVSEAELVEALPAVREAIRLMEQVYLRTGFGRDDRAASNRPYMGWFNRFGLWATAPVFRCWWPWLAPFHSGDFVDFMEGIGELGLPPTVPRAKKKGPVAGGERTVVLVPPGDQSTKGFARSRFDALAAHGAGAGATPPSEIYELHLAMPHTSKRLNAAVLRLTVDGDGGTRKIARWKPDDLYVPPGLWAIGVGERFVQTLIEQLPGLGFRRIEVDARGRQSISEDALYTGAGFAHRPGGGYEKELSAPAPAFGAGGGRAPT